MFIIGVDTGGTFTDFIYIKGNEAGFYKLLSTPSNPAIAVLEGLKKIAGEEKKKIIHGSTIATNALLEKKGAVTALITNAGFEDIIEIGRQNRTNLYDLVYKKEKSVIPAELRIGIRGRITYDGHEIEPIDTMEIQGIMQHLTDIGVRSIAVCLLFSFSNPVHEKILMELSEKTGIPVSVSHEILSEFREFERTSTTVINAYVMPNMRKYIGYLKKHLAHHNSLSIMQSNGGSISSENAMKEPVRTILSGPAGGAAGAFETGRIAGITKIIGFDMGGTSTDVCLMNNHLPFATETSISGYPVKVPIIDIHTVGAGGGSLVFLDAGGALKVGPQSAGADPGPICYGKGKQITVTDANLYLGRLIPEYFLGGNMKLHRDRLDEPFTILAKTADISELELAEGILRVANAVMEKAIRVISVEKGFDPADFTLLAYGGAGGMHAAFLASLLGIHEILVPDNPGLLSAMGMLLSDILKDYSLTIMKKQSGLSSKTLSDLFLTLEKKGISDLTGEGIPEERQVLEKYLDMRYEGQSHEIIVPFTSRYIESFYEQYSLLYGYENHKKEIEIVNIRLRARGIPDKPVLKRYPHSDFKPSADAFLGKRDVVFDLKKIKTDIVLRDRLQAGNRIKGPAILTEYSSTIVIPPFAEAAVDEYKNIIITLST